MNAPFPDPRDSMTRDEVLFAWQRSQHDLKIAKENEMEWRKYVVKRAFPEAKEGTNTTELGNGYALKAVVKYNYKLLPNEVVEHCLERISKIGNQGSFIADRLVSWTPNFLLQEYRALQEGGNQEILKIVNEMLIITEAAPTLEIKEPRKK